HRPRARLRKTEVDAGLDAALERVAVREGLVRDAVQVPRLVCEHGDRARRLRERRHSVLEPQLVELVAERRNEIRNTSADECGAVRLLDDADVTARRVADDPGGAAGDRRGLE